MTNEFYVPPTTLTGGAAHLSAPKQISSVTVGSAKNSVTEGTPEPKTSVTAADSEIKKESGEAEPETMEPKTETAENEAEAAEAAVLEAEAAEQ